MKTVAISFFSLGQASDPFYNRDNHRKQPLILSTKCGRKYTELLFYMEAISPYPGMGKMLFQKQRLI